MDGDANFALVIATEEDEEALLSSDEENTGELEIEAVIVTSLLFNTDERRTRITIRNYGDEVVQGYCNEAFQSHFRIKRSCLAYLVDKFELSHEFKSLLTPRSRINISAEKHVLVFLWFAGHQSASYRDIADRWDLSLSSLFDVITRISRFLCSIKSDIIKIPNNLGKQKSKQYFYEKYGFPDIIGAIDGCHIKIDKPVERHTDYFNRKHFYSLILQGTCNEDRKFIDVFIGMPGSVHDARVFKNSDFYNKHIEELAVGEEYILADSAYPLLPTVITPYRDNGHLSRQQKHFNIVHSSCRVIIEHTFGILKQRFRQLYHIKLRNIQRICQFIMACCVLHNLTIGDGLQFNTDNDVLDEQPETETFLNINARTDGVYYREKLARSLK